jgi:hypothetical protein
MSQQPTTVAFSVWTGSSLATTHPDTREAFTLATGREYAATLPDAAILTSHDGGPWKLAEPDTRTPQLTGREQRLADRLARDAAQDPAGTEDRMRQALAKLGR